MKLQPNDKKGDIMSNLIDDVPDALNPDFIFNQTDTTLLLEMIYGKIDPKRLIREQLISRGVDDNGEFIGFNNARAYWNAQI